MIKRYTLIAALFTLPLLGAYYWWFQGGLIVNGVYLSISAIAVLSIPIMYRVMGYANADDSQWLKQREHAEHEEITTRLASLRSELKQLELPEALRQSTILTGLVDDYHAVVNTRFIGKKDSPLTYIGAARTVQRNAMQNLTDIVAIGHSLSTISRNQRAPENIHTPEQQKRNDKQTNLYAEQQTRLNTLREQNNTLFDALTETAIEVANIPSLSEFERTDTLARLVSLAQIANSKTT